MNRRTIEENDNKKAKRRNNGVKCQDKDTKNFATRQVCLVKCDEMKSK